LTFHFFDSQCIFKAMMHCFMLGKRAKILSDNNIRDLLAFTTRTRHPLRNRVIVLLSVKVGLRAGEIANLTWPMVTDSAGEIGFVIALEDRVAKKKSGRVIPIHPTLREALMMLRPKTSADGTVITSERGGPMTPLSIVNWFTTAYRAIGVTGCSSHSGRRTFVTRAARLVDKAGGSLRDVQLLAGHRSILTTQRYIDGDSDAQRRLVALI
jgi:integrase